MKKIYKVFLLALLGLVMHSAGYAYITVSGNIATDQTWTSGNTYFINMNNWLAIYEDVTLTIEAGVVVKFNDGGEILSDGGTLNVIGQSSSPVIFTSMHDNSVGETISGSSGTPAPGDWYGIFISNDNIYNTDADANISYGEFRYGGIIHFQSDLASSLDHINISYFDDYGLFVDNTPVTADNIHLSHSVKGICLSQCNTSDFTNIMLDNILESALLTLHYCEVPDLTTWNFTGNADQYILLYGGVVGNSQLDNIAPLVYVLYSHSETNKEFSIKNLLIQEGTILKINSGVYLHVDDGTLNVNGTKSNPVIFTSYKDDEFGGDTNGDGDTTLPAKGDWSGIYIDGTSSSTYAKAKINWAWIRFAGAGGGQSLEFDGASSPSYLYNSRIEYSEGTAVDINQCSPSIYNNTFLYNDSSDVRIMDNASHPNLGSSSANKGGNVFRKNNLDIHNTTTNIINAKYNDWGSEDSTVMSQRLGNNDPNTGSVDFYPWFGNEDDYWYTYDKTAIENAGVYNQLLIPYVDASAGTAILYQTGEGRYGKMKILQRTMSTMTLWWETYNSDGSTYSAGTNLSLASSGDADLCELDRGIRGTYLNTADEAEFYINADGSLLTMPGTKFLVAYSYCTPMAHSGGTSGNQTWGAGTHYVSSDFTINGGDTLFIEPGAIVKFGMGIKLTGYGVLMALGTQSDSIWFTSTNDDLHGCIIDGSTGNPQAGDWNYIAHNGYYERHGEYRFCNFAYGGNSSSAMLSYSNIATGFVKQCTLEYSSSNALKAYQSDITVDSCTFKDNSNHGIEYAYYSTVRVNNSSFLNNGNYAVVTGSSDIEPCSNNYATGNNLNGMVIIALGTSNYQQLINYNSMPFIIYGTVNIGSGKSLHIGDGNGTTLIKMNTNAKIQLSGGHLNASSAIFTSIKDDSKGGDTNNDGDATSPAPGDWQNIYIQYDHDAYIWGCEIYYGGSSTAAVYYANGAGGDLNNSSIKYSLNHGVYSSSSPLDIWACDILENTKSGVYIYGNDSTLIRQSRLKDNGEHGVILTYGSSAIITDNEIEDNAQYPIYYYGSSNLKSPITGNVLEGNLLDAVVINSLDWYKKQRFFEITGDQSSIKYSYVFLNNSMIYSTTDTLEFNTGSVVKFNDHIYLQTKGAIIANNTVFTSLHDDTKGGDTENNGSTSSPSKGDWSYIEIDQGGVAKYDYCDVRYGGYNNYASVIYYTNAFGHIKNSWVSFSSSDGISKSYAGNVEIRDNTIIGNDRYGINVYGTQDTLIIDGNTISQSGSHAVYLSSTVSTDINNNAFENNGGYPVYYTGTPTIDDQFTGNTSSGNLMEGFAIQGFNGYSHNILYYQEDLPFIFLNNMISYSTVDTFQVESMATIKFFPDVKLEFRGPVITHGGLMTSIKDDAWGGDTNNDGDATVAAPGDWKGLELYNTRGEFHGFIIRYAGGGSTPALNFNQSNGFIYTMIDSSAYDGLRLYNSSNVEVDNSDFSGNARYGININSIDTIQITNCTIGGNGSHGIYNLNTAPALDNNTFTDNVGYPVYFTNGSIINKPFTGNTSSGNLMEGFAVQSFDGYAHNILYHQDDIPFIFPNNIISYSSTDTFQIENATLKFLPDVELELWGPIITNGGVLTSIKDDEWDGDSNNDASATSPAPGDWRDLEIYNTHGELNGTTIRYGGASSYPALHFNNSNGYVDVKIDSSAYDGLYVYSSSNFTIENSEFTGNGRYGIRTNSVDTLQVSGNLFQGNGSHGIYNSNSAPNIVNNTFTDNGGYPVYFTGGSIINKPFTGNTTSGNLMEGFAVKSFNGYAHNILYHQDDIPFIFPDNIISYSTTDTFQIENATLKFLPDVKLELRGPIITNGGIFTSIKDDEWDGDSNNDASATSPAPGDWRDLEIYNTHGEFNGTRIRYAGGLSNPALYFNSSNGYIDVSIDSSAYDGLYLYNGSNVEVVNSEFIGSTRYGIRLNSVDTALISNSIIQGNQNHGVYVQYSNAKLRGNSITNNVGYGIYNVYAYAANILDLGNNDVNDKGENTIKNNDSGNYQLYNNTSNEINAFYNDWGYNTAAEIDAHIYDNDEDASKGEVHFNPWYVYNLAVDVKAILEGTFNGTDMDTDLNSLGLIPLAQPFNAAPWNYAGNESVVAIPNANVVDWVLLELRDATNAASAGSGTIIDQKAGFLLKDGSIVDINGTSTLSFASNVSQSLFVVVHHRNHLKVMSNNALTQSGGVYTYDFTTGISQAFDNDEKMVSGKAVLYGGDANADGEIGTVDATIWHNEVGTAGYLKTDVTFDGQSDNRDKNDIFVPNNGVNSHIPN